MKKRFNSYKFQKWTRNASAVCAQFIIPLTIFQAVRTVFFPTTFDVLLLTLLIILAAAVYLEWV
ncbi:hypothetical protein [Priestia abyssalis]|uniref:hypothetical protein n=1 Tax=Priestia abyssalis TaxID=1221450 RepID=UPI0004193A29|nr:hypothetical protein [Priestia abyssalis]MDQ0244631.1 hypothetical protein [Bacillus fengqiuensis]